MKRLTLQFNCAKCGKLLGFYSGDEFTLMFEGSAVAAQCWCDDCAKASLSQEQTTGINKMSGIISI